MEICRVLGVKKLISLTHLGHRGVSAKLPTKIVTKMVKSGAKPELLKVILGPGIRKESYVFELVNQKDDPEWKPFLQLRPKGLISIDLAGYILKQLKDSGVVSENITDTEIDTGSNPDYFSHFVAVKNDLKEGRFLSALRLI